MEVVKLSFYSILYDIVYEKSKQSKQKLQEM